MLGVNITNRAGYGVKKPTTTVFLHYLIEMEFEDKAGCFECHQSGVIALFLDMDENYPRPKDEATSKNNLDYC